jgi:sigma-B regulation protein RsbU (phosphoserine phosphatase)
LKQIIVKEGLSLAARLMLLIGSAAVAIFISVACYYYVAASRTAVEGVKEDALNITLAAANRIEVIMRSVEKITLNLAAILADSCSDRQNLKALLGTFLDSNNEIFGMAAAFEPYAFEADHYYFGPYAYRGKEGTEIKFLGSEFYNYHLMDWYQIPKELERPVWSVPYFDEGGGGIIMSTYSVPIFKGNGPARRFMGVVTADISLSWLREWVGAIKVLDTGYAFVVSQNGDFVTHPIHASIMKEGIFSLSEERSDAKLRNIGIRMVGGQAGYEIAGELLEGRRSFLFFSPLGSTGWSIGVVFPEEELMAPVKRLANRLIVIGGAGVALLLITVIFLSRGITRPLADLTAKIKTIGGGEFSVRVPEGGPREISHLARSFNELGSLLTQYIEKRDFIRDTFGRYVTAEVVKKLMESADGLELGGERRDLTILMSDLRGFTALVRDMEPEQVISILNRYLSSMIEILMDHRAVIDEIIGDGILAFFGAPEPMADHAFKAVSCALKMQNAMEEINAFNKARGLGSLEMGIAVNSGDVIVGNIGSKRRTKYGVVGHQVNFTGRMESFTLGGQVLVSKSTYDRVKEVLEVREVFTVNMKGVHGPVTLYEAVGLKGEDPVSLKRQDAAMRAISGRVEIRIFPLKGKVVSDEGLGGFILHIGPDRMLVGSKAGLSERGDVLIELECEALHEKPTGVFGKVTAVRERGGDGVEVEVRFTSPSSDVKRFVDCVLGS